MHKDLPGALLSVWGTVSTHVGVTAPLLQRTAASTRSYIVSDDIVIAASTTLRH